MLTSTYLHTKNVAKPILHTTHKNNSQGIMDLNPRAKNRKHLGKNIGMNLCDLGLGNIFSDATPKPKVIQEKLGNLDFIKIKNFYAANNTTKKVQR